MKERVAKAGLRVPYAFRCKTNQEIEEAVEKIGYPVIIKPIAGAGSADTYRVDGAKELSQVLKKIQHVKEVSTEEFVDGREFTYILFVSKENPLRKCRRISARPLIARSNEWISPIIITVRDLNAPLLQPGLQSDVEFSKLLIWEPDLHMEWYLTDKGEVVFGEIGCRPGGAHLVDQMNFTSDIDLFREWARAVCYLYAHQKSPVCLTVQLYLKGHKDRENTTYCWSAKLYAKKFGRAVMVENLLKPANIEEIGSKPW